VRWPLSRRPRAAAHVTPSADVPAARQPRAELHPELDPGRSRPRADWAHLETLRPVSASAAPLTFHGERFGRSVAGARPLLRPPLPRRSGAAVAGVLLDVVEVETIVPAEPPAGSAGPTSATRSDRASAGGNSGVPVAPHRKPAVTAAVVDPLVVANTTFPWTDPTPRPKPLADVDMSWTPETGFRRARPGRSVPVVAEPAADADSAGGASAEPQVRYLPAVGSRPVEEWPTPPPDVVGAVAATTGVHIGDALIDRSPAAGARAGDLGAVAFTQHGVVRLPAELGPLDVPAVRAVLAHELTHVAQYRRRGGDVPPEDTREGRALEAEARNVQATIQSGGPVVPAFRRDHPGATRREGPVGVQRLAADEDPYAWQNRPMSGDDQALALFGDHGYGFAAGSSAATRRDASERAADERFEHTHARELQDRRVRRWNDIYADAERDARTAAAREDREFEHLSRREVLALREQLDEEMPFEYGIPPGIADPYPGPFPPPNEEERRAEELRRAHPTSPHGPTSRAPGHGPARSAGARHAPVVGGIGRHHGPGSRAGREQESAYAWQGREPTGREANEALFGGGLFGALIGLGISDADERADRQRMEQEELPQLLGRRLDREIELRHRRLRERHTELVRSPEPPPAPNEPARPSPWPARLTDEEINAIRAQIDQEMPLEFHTMRSEDYLDRDHQVEIIQDGTFADRTGETPTPPVPTAPPAPTASTTTTAPPTPAPTTAPTTAPTPTIPSTAPAPTPPATTASTGTTTDTPSVDTTAAATAPAETQPAEVAPEPVVAPAAGPGGALVGAAAGAAVGAGVARLAEDAESHNADELMARRVFAAATDLDLDSLTRRLYSRIRRELRTELLVDRERSGSLADAR
jgi:hypothetical protein